MHALLIALIAMHTLTAALLAEQQKDHILPVVSATLSDNRRPRFAALHHLSANSALGDAVATADAIVRVQSRTGGIFAQRITSPGDVSQWSTWSLVANPGSLYQLSIFYDGTHVVIAYVTQASPSSVQGSRSADGGLTWSAITAYTISDFPSEQTDIGSVSAGATRSGVVAASRRSADSSTVDLRLLLYSSATSSFSAGPIAAAFAQSNNTAIAISAAYRSGTDDYAVAVAYPPVFAVDPNQPTPIRTLRVNASTWFTSELRYYAPTSPETAPAYTNGRVTYSQAAINNHHWLVFIRQYPSTNLHYLVGRSPAGQNLSAPARLPLPVDGVQPNCRMLEHAGYIYLITNFDVYRAGPPNADRSAQVIEYHYRDGVLTATLADPDGTLGASPLAQDGHLLTLTRGAATRQGDQTVTLGQFTLTHAQARTGALDIKANTGIRQMQEWVADASLQWAGQLQTLLAQLAALADVHTLSVDAAGVWSDSLTAFVVPRGATGARVLSDLYNYHPFLLDMTVAALTARVPAAGDASSYDFDDHAGIRSGLTAYAVTPNVAHVEGLAVSAEAFSAQRADLPHLLLVVNRRITTSAAAIARAAAAILQADEERRPATLKTLPHFGVQVGDVVTYAAARWRVLQVEERYRRGADMQQTLTLRGLA